VGSDVSPELILRARAGDDVAQEALIRVYQEPVGRFVVSQVGNRDEYLDLCQVVFVKMLRGLPRLKSPEAFEPWLYRIARNVCTDHLRRRGVRQRHLVPLASHHEQVPMEPPRSSPELDSLRSAVDRLAPNQRQLIDLSMEQPRSYDELAGLTNSSVGSVRNRLSRARERLKKMMRFGKEEP
jgi:RNA polymerase sigma-70 factor (ECF subfamily)